MKEKTLKFIRNNYMPVLFAVCAVLMELTAVFVTSEKFYIKHPAFYFSVLAILTVIQFFMKSNRARHIYSSVVLSVFFILDLLFIIIFEMNGTIFDFSMLKLRGDAMAILESVPINFAYTTVSGIILSAFIVFGNIFDTGETFKSVTVNFKRVIALVLVAILIIHGTVAYDFIKIANKNDDYIKDKLYKTSASGYANMGVVGTFMSELYQGTFNKVDVGDAAELDDFIYKKITGNGVPGFGEAKDYNVVTILGESFEWFSFMNNQSHYPNGHTLSESELRELYPNLYRLYDNSCVMTNFHSREKTDISENLSVIGSYPLDYYLNYDYPYNNIAYSMPNLMRDLFTVESKSFHNGMNTFYNRSEYLPNGAGFSAFVGSDEMEAQGMVNYAGENGRNLDSKMIETCKKEMFPTDRRFYTYITTITMHGQYSYRENLQEYYDILDEKQILPLLPENLPENESKNAFRYYAAATMEFDRAIGAILDYLDETGLSKNTIVTVFGDHNVYYQSLSNYVKNIYPKTDPTSDITELYRVPLMIKIGDQPQQVKIDKFTCTSDIVPTLMSLLGIKYYSNLYYGHSVFSDEESLLYSRAYDVFMTDKIYFNSLNDIVYPKDGVSDKYYKEVEQRALELMNKTSHINRIYASDYFTGNNLKKFKRNMKKIN